MSAVRDVSGEKFKNYKDYSYCLTSKLDLNLCVRMQVAHAMSSHVQYDVAAKH